VINFVHNLSRNGSESDNQDKTRDSDWDGLTDWEEVNVYHTDPHKLDTDGDFIRDGLEVKTYHTNPLKMDTSGLGLDDFNAIFTYQINPNNQTAVREVLSKIPNVDVRHWNQSDGDVGWYTDEKYALISSRDPLVQWFAKRAEIKWEPGTMALAGEIIGRLKINGDDAFKGEYGPSEVTPSIDNPSYYLTHGRKGPCTVSALTNLVILRLMDGSNNKAIRVDGKIGDVGHAWCEAFINGKAYVVDYIAVVPRESCYKNSNYVINTPNYDPNWFSK